jgi:hypothetical protein
MRQLNRWIQNLLAHLILASFVLYLAFVFYTAEKLSLWMIFPWLLLMVGLFWFSVLFHELGHLIAGWLVGYQITEFVAFPIRLVLVEGRWQWQLMNEINLPAFVRGMPLPAHLSSHRMRQFFFILGGPLFDLILCLASAYFVAQYVSVIDMDVSRGWRHCGGASLLPFYSAGYLALTNGLLLLSSLVPEVERDGLPNDGAQLLNVFRDYGTKEILNLELNAAMIHGTRPRDLDRAQLLECLGLPAKYPESARGACLLAYYHFLDNQSYQVAEALLERAKQYYLVDSDFSRPNVLFEEIYFHAMYREPFGDAWQTLEKNSNTMHDEPSTRLRAIAAMHFVEGRYEEAILHANEGIRLLKENCDKGGSLGEADWLQEILTQCESRLSHRASTPPAS